jgi:hypothetical protein
VLLVLLLFTGLGILVGASTSGAAFGAYNVAWDGAGNLREVAGDTSTESTVLLNTSEYPQTNTSGTVAVILSPDEGYGPQDRQRVRTFVRTGGTLVVAEDFGNHSNQLLTAVGASARFNGSLLRDERYYYRTPAMPYASNVSRPNTSLGDTASLVRNVSQLTLNHGTAIEPANASVLVSSSEFGYIDTNRNASLDEHELLGTYPVVTVEPVARGRVVTVSDPSLLINAMLDQPDNRAFVTAVFAPNEAVLLDYSHARNLPPLAVFLIIVRGAPLLQIGLLGVMFIIIGAWGRGQFDPLVTRLQADNQDKTPAPGLDTDGLVAHVERQHPDWDPERVRRVTEGVISNQSQNRPDE